MAAMISAFDWAETPLGDISGWSAGMRANLSLMLFSQVPMAMLLGREGTMLYNDAYIPIAGGRHPSSLGASVLEAWPEVADFNRLVIGRVHAGEAPSYANQRFVFERNGEPEDVYLDLDYSPLHDQAGQICGVLTVIYEVTQTFKARKALDASSRKLAFLDALGLAVADCRDADDVLSYTTRLTGEHLSASNCAYADMDADEDGFTIRGNWHADGALSILGRYRLVDFGPRAVEDLRAGRPLVVNNVARELTPLAARTFGSIGIAATICMPLVKGGKLIALMAIHDNAPRQWSDYDLDIAREVTQRSWAHVERVGAQAALLRGAEALRDLNETLERRVEERTRRLSEAEDALRQAQKMEAVGQLTGGLAHDFNNLLMALGGSLEMVRSRLAQGRVEEVTRHLDNAESAIGRASALTHRLLAFARRQTLDPAPTDINQLVAGLEELVARTVGPQIAVHFSGDGALWPSMVDRNQLENAMLNLCINARDAMPDGGTLSIATANRTLDAPAAQRLGLNAGDYAEILVADTGMGMSAAVVASAFDPFFTTKPLGQGTGLGLSMIYGFARQSGGDVRIVSAPGHGTSVYMLLPRLAGWTEPFAQEPCAATAVAAAQGCTVLVVDDEPMIRMLVVEVLEDEGFTVIEASDGPGAVAQLDRIGQLDLLVTDVGLPNGMNGRQVADLAREARADLKVLFITGYAETAVASDGGLEAGSAILTKPFLVDALVARVHELLADRAVPAN